MADLRCKDLCMTFTDPMSGGKVEALKNIQFDLKEGQILTATTRALTTWGAFLEYKSVTMLLHISDMSFGH